MYWLYHLHHSTHVYAGKSPNHWRESPLFSKILFSSNFMKPYLEDRVGHIEEQGKAKCQTVEAHLPGVCVHLEEHLGNKYTSNVTESWSLPLWRVQRGRRERGSRSKAGQCEACFEIKLNWEFDKILECSVWWWYDLIGSLWPNRTFTKRSRKFGDIETIEMWEPQNSCRLLSGASWFQYYI